MRVNFFELFEQYFTSIRSEVEDDLQEKLGNIRRSLEIKIKAIEYGKRKKTIRTVFSIAAIFILFLSVTLFYIIPKDNPDGALKRAIVDSYDFRNNTTKTISEVLTDSSVVNLWPDSEIRIDSNYNKKNRSLILIKGRAMFYVKKGKLPFIVDAQGIQTVALGTKFSVEMKGTHLITVHLVEGRVKVINSVRNPNEEIYLLPGKTIHFNTSQTQTKKNVQVGMRETNVFDENSVSPKDILFEQTPVSEVLYSIGEEYRVKIEVENGLVDSLTFSGTIRKGTRFIDAIKSVCLLNDLKFSNKEGTITVNKEVE